MSSRVLVFPILLLAPAAHAADTVEAFEPGITDYEVHATHHLPWEGQAASELTAVVGAGLGDRLSLSTFLTLDPQSGGPTSFAGLGLWVGLVEGPVALDLLGELGWGVGAPSGSWGLGFELDDRRRALVPYLRVMAWGEDLAGPTVMEPTLGLALRPGEARFNPHLEVSTSVGAEGMGNVSLSFGPNVALLDAVELVPDVTIGFGRDCACGWALSLGVIATLGG